MHRKQSVDEETAGLRRRAELMLEHAIAKTVPSLAQESVEALVHELRVHQVELEMQCDELRRSREEAEKSRDRYWELYESAPVPYVTVDAQWRIDQINRAGEQILGLLRAELLGHPLAEFIAEQDVLRFIQHCRAVFKGSDITTCELRLRTAGMNTILIETRAVGADPDRRLRIAMVDITERKLAEDQLRKQGLALAESQGELQELSARLLSMEQEVRRRTAHELQEEFSQRMTTLVWELSGLEQRQGLDVAVASKLQNVKQRLSHIGVDLHHLAHRLHSGFLEHCELHVAMKEYVDELNMLARPKILFEADNVPASCRPERAVALFRVMQEGLQNVFRHAEPRSIHVALAATDSHLVLTVHDEGRGFDTNVRERAHPGFGLIIMRERMRAVAGTCVVESRPGEGTTITASVPIVRCPEAHSRGQVTS